MVKISRSESVKVINRLSSTQMYISFIDLTAVYHKIPRKLLFCALDIRLGCHNVISLLKAIYIGTTEIITSSRISFPMDAESRRWN